MHIRTWEVNSTVNMLDVHPIDRPSYVMAGQRSTVLDVSFEIEDLPPSIHEVLMSALHQNSLERLSEAISLAVDHRRGIAALPKTPKYVKRPQDPTEGVSRKLDI